MFRTTSMYTGKRLLLVLPLWVVICFISLAGRGWAIQLNNADAIYHLGGEFVYRVDDSSSLTIQDIAASLGNEVWLPSPDDYATIGNTDVPHWFTLTLNPELADQVEWFLSVNHASLEEVDIYLLAGGDVVEHISAGTRRPEAAEEIGVMNAFRLSLQPEQSYTLVIRTYIHGILDLPAYIATPQAFTRKSHDTGYLMGTYYGIAVVMVIYNLFLFFSTRDRAYLYYVAFVASMALFIGSTESIPLWKYIYGFDLFRGRAVAIFGAIMFAAGVHFAGSFLSLSQQGGKLAGSYRFMHWLTLVNVLAAIILPSDKSFMASGTVALMVFPSLLLFGWVMMLRGHRYARYFVIAWSLVCVMCIGLALAALNIINVPMEILIPLVKATTTLEMVLLALGLGARINYLRLSEEEARAESEAKTEFIAQLSHELRTPMNGILGMSEMLREKLKDETARHYNNVIYQSGLAMIDVINDVLAAARMEFGNLELSKQAFDLRELIAKSLHVIEPAAMNKNLALSLEYDESLSDVVYGDPKRVRQILLNYLGNAAKYTEQGAITVTVKPAREGGNAIYLEVADTGPGIAREHQQALFSAYNDDPLFAEANMSSGLGLFICKKLADLMNGRVGYQQASEGGSRFWVVLPLPASKEPPKAMDWHFDEEFSEASGRALKILVAEDNAVNQTVISYMLQSLGHQVTVVADGRKAVDGIQGSKGGYDLVLMDCEMPELDGYAATEEIRQWEQEHAQQPVPIVAISAHALGSYRQRCLDSGMNAHLTKPIDRDTLAGVINDVVGLDAYPA